MKCSIQLCSLLFAALPIAVPATLLSGCNVQPEAERCIDSGDLVLPYSECSRPAQSVAVEGSLSPMPNHRFYYGGYGGEDLGSHAWGGSERPLGGHVYQASTTGNATPVVPPDSHQPYTVATPH